MFFKRQSSKVRPSTAKTRFRPRLEVLEDRFMPATRIWDGGAISNNWSNSSNWQSNIAPVAGDDLVFPAGNFDKTADNDFANGTNFRSISVGGGYTLKGNRVFLGAGGLISSGSSNIIKNDLDIGASGGSRFFQVNTGSTLFVDGVIQGSNGFNKLGAGNLSLRANNTYEGITAVQAGALFVEKDESLGGSLYGTNVFAGATFVANDQALGVLRINERVTFLEGTTLRALNDVQLTGDLQFLGDVTVRQESAIGADMLRMQGVISGSGGMTVVAKSRVRLNADGANSFQGTTRVLGELRLNNRATSLSGPLVIEDNGRVILENDEQLSNQSDITVNEGGRLALNTHTETVASLTIRGGEVVGFEERFIGGVIDGASGKLEIANLTVLGQLTATSTSTNQYAIMNGVELAFQGTPSNIQVTDGPAFTDLLIANTMLPNVTTKKGTGAILDRTEHALLPTLNADYSIDNVLIIDEGLVRIEYQQRITEVVVNAGGRFASGSVIKELTVHAGGRVRPGLISARGVMTIRRDLILDPGAIVEAVFDGTTPGSGYDQLDVDGKVQIEGAILEATLGSNASLGQTYRLINNGQSDGVLGQFFVPPATSPFQTASPTGQRLAFNYSGGTLNNDLEITLQNTPPMAPNLTLNCTELNEGGTVTASGRLVDPDTNDKLRLFVNWGDGSRQEVFRPGRDFFSNTHRYHSDGNYTARFEWLDQTGQGNSREFNVTVNNVAPVLTWNTFRTTSSGVLLASGWLSDAGNDRYTATLDFGDGSPIRSKSLYHRDYFAVAHRYRNPGTYTVTLTLRDAQGAEKIEQRKVNIS